MTSTEIKNLDAQYVVQSYGRCDVVIDHGKGSTLWTPEGREYIDFTSGIGVNSLGYGNEKWIAAVTEQAAKLGHISNLFYSEPYAKLAATLCRRAGMKRVFFANGGGEANEGMIKCARKYSFDKYGDGRSTIVTLYQSFHGRTVTTLSATGQDVFHNYFFPFTPGFRYAKANDITDLKNRLGDDVCAVMIELIQGEGGVLPLDRDFVSELAAICADNDILLLVDEVQTGVGRTGSLFCFEQYGLKPDAVSFAKGIAGGLPMGGVMFGAKTEGVLTPGTHATTFGGNPVAAAAANAVLAEIDDDFLKSVTEKGDYIRNTVKNWNLPAVTKVKGMGLMIGIAVTVPPKTVLAKCIENGLLVLTAGKDTVRLLPPLTISKGEIDKGLEILHNVLKEI